MECYGAFAKDDTLRMCGSSGGVFPVLSRLHIAEGGVVYASVYDESFFVKVERISEIQELKKSFTSKYLQSRIEDSFKNVRADLNNGKKILFCGTPCQVAGLFKYLSLTKTDMSNLLLIDFICHGVPSEEVFQKYIVKYNNPNCVSVNMRSKVSGWDYGNYSWEFSFSDGTQKRVPQKEVAYMRGFLSNLFLRPSCYECPTKGKSYADITLGDFWGISNIKKDISTKLGVSCVIIRSEKGSVALSFAKEDLSLFSVAYSDIAAGNLCLVKPAKKPFKRKKFFKLFKQSQDVELLIKNIGRRDLKDRVIDKLYSKIPKKGTSIRDLTTEPHNVVYSKKEDCCGCMACYNICPLSAISLKKDGEGFFYPVIDSAMCVSCGLCQKTCICKE